MTLREELIELRNSYYNNKDESQKEELFKILKDFAKRGHSEVRIAMHNLPVLGGIGFVHDLLHKEDLHYEIFDQLVIYLPED